MRVSRADLLRGTGLILFYLGAFNGVFAENGGTCTQGGADHLLGIVISIVLYVPAFALLAKGRSSRDTFVVMALGLLAIAWQIWFAIRLAAGVFLWKLSACAVIEGDAGWEFDGREVLFAILWLAMSLEVIVGTALVFGRWAGENV